MDTINLKIMIERFFNAELSVEEERELCRYLRENALPEEYTSDKEVIIALCDDSESVTVPQGVEERLVAMIDEFEECSLQTTSDDDAVSLAKRKRIVVPRYILSGAAAAAIVLLLLFSPIDKRSVPSGEQPTFAMTDLQEEDTFDNPEDAMRCVQTAFKDMLLAANTTHRNAREIGVELERSVIKCNK